MVFVSRRYVLGPSPRSRVTFTQSSLRPSGGSGSEFASSASNVRVQDLGASKWEPFFVKGDDGKYQLVDAKFVLPEEWSFTEDGVLCGVHSKSQKNDGLVISTKNYDDFIARVTYRMHGGNSALYFRAEETTAPWVLRGFQNEIANNGRDSALWHTAGIIDGKKVAGRGWVVTNDEFVVRNNPPPTGIVLPSIIPAVCQRAESLPLLAISFWNPRSTHGAAVSSARKYIALLPPCMRYVTRAIKLS